MKVVYECDIDSPSGYSRASRMMIKALLLKGVEVAVEHVKKDVVNVELDDYWANIIEKLRTAPKEKGIKLWHETPEFYYPDRRDFNISMLAWETSRIIDYDIGGNVQNNWVKQLNRMDEVWTFCNRSKKAFIESGVTTPVYVIPHPIDLELYSPGKGKDLCNEYGRPVSENKFKILNVAQWTGRKNPVDMLVAYWSTFNGHKDTLLLVKTFGSAYSQEEIGLIMNKMRTVKIDLRMPDPPTVQGMWTALSEKDMPGLYKSSDAHFSTTCCEGFGLNFQESMACGIPCIFPRHSSIVDFCDDEVGYGIDVAPEPVRGMPKIPWYEGNQMWWRPVYSSTKRALEQAYNDWRDGTIHEKGKKARRRIEELHSFSRVGNLMVERLEAAEKSYQKKLQEQPG